MEKKRKGVMRNKVMSWQITGNGKKRKDVIGNGKETKS